MIFIMPSRNWTRVHKYSGETTYHANFRMTSYLSRKERSIGVNQQIRDITQCNIQHAINKLHSLPSDIGEKNTLPVVSLCYL